jgi:putative acetyltransferase
MIVRDVVGADHATIDVVVDDAFAALAAAGQAGGEASLVRALRDGGHAVVELVAVDDDGALVGHALYSTMTSTPAGLRAVALAPLSVRSSWQRRGVGMVLMRAAHERLAREGYDVVVVLGHPDYYPRAGFDAALAARHLRTPYDGPHLMALALRGLDDDDRRDGPWTLTYAPPLSPPPT